MRKLLLAGAGSVAAAFLGSLCCVGPLLFVTLGVGAGLASTFEPLRPVFGLLMLVLLALGFHAVYGRGSVGRRTAGGDGSAAAVEGAPGPTSSLDRPARACEVPRRRRDVVVLWTAAVLALVLWIFPTWSRLLI